MSRPEPTDDAPDASSAYAEKPISGMWEDPNKYRPENGSSQIKNHSHRELVKGGSQTAPSWQ